ncbi:Hypothetical predicted protein, partial [Pelobates cultripes]
TGIRAIGERKASLKDRADELVDAHNSLAEADALIETKLQKLEDKLSDHEDRLTLMILRCTANPDYLRDSPRTGLPFQNLFEPEYGVVMLLHFIPLQEADLTVLLILIAYLT